VGFFVAEEMEDLLMAIDECLDAADCEYVELPAGGILWSSPVTAIPLDPGREEENSDDGQKLPWAKAELSEAWWSVVYGYSDDEWTEFFPGRPHKPRSNPRLRPMGPGRVVPYRKRT
jgi:hypothetical protein